MLPVPAAMLPLSTTPAMPLAPPVVSAWPRMTTLPPLVVMLAPEGRWTPIRSPELALCRARPVPTVISVPPL